MTIFHLPDLGEGLAEATIHEWHIKVGDEIKTDQNMISVETAKALVDIPSPFTGKVSKLFFNAGDTVKTGEALLEIATESTTATVAGKLETSEIVLDAENVQQISAAPTTWQSKAEKLSAARLAMAYNMKRSHREVVPACIFEEVVLPEWPEKTDITAKLVQAVCYACQQAPALNAWYDGSKQVRLLHEKIHLGLAMDMPQGLFVPVIKNAEQLSPIELRKTIEAFKQQLTQNKQKPELFQGATITLSNIGNIAGRFAVPVVIPPTVAIIAIGKSYETVIAQEGKLISARALPLSLSFDHRAVTGAEGSRFISAMQKYLQQ
jgi:2-oxoisovalerate dehydrogenase E2 component (dihydrolipoyl transacylase)